MSSKKTTTQSLQADPEIRSRGLQLYDSAAGMLPGGGLNSLQTEALNGYRGLTDPGQLFGQNIGSFMNPYLDQVVGQNTQDLNRAREMANLDARSLATRQGAFGGDRAALLEAENSRNFLDSVARSSGQLRSAGFDMASRNLYNYAGMGLNALGQIGGMGNQQMMLPYQNLQSLGGLLGSIQGNREMTNTQYGSPWGTALGLGTSLISPFV